jgi:AraC-like DNA-binding protein
MDVQGKILHMGQARDVKLPNAGAFAAFSTHAVPPAQRAEYWREDVLRKLDLTGDAPPDGHLRRVLGEDAELLEHSAGGLHARRDARRCRQDGCDDLCLDFVVASAHTTMTHRGARRLRTGDLVVIDCAQPHEISRSRHRIISLFLPRSGVRAAFADPALLAGRLLGTQGVPALLRAHMLATMDQAAHLRPEERILAVGAARDMALCILRAQAQAPPDDAAVEAGIYHAALLLIERECQRPELTPDLVAATLGCSRAALYRIFARQRGGVALAIWNARLAAAQRLLVADSCRFMRISDVAYRCGFADPASFGRMFKRLHGMTPREMREGSKKELLF